MGVRHHRGGPQGQQGPGQFPGREHAALQVQVAVDETGQEIAALELQSGTLVISQPGDNPVKQGHVKLLPLSGIDVGHHASGQHQIRRCVPPGHLEPPLQSFLIHALHSFLISSGLGAQRLPRRQPAVSRSLANSLP